MPQQPSTHTPQPAIHPLDRIPAKRSEMKSHVAGVAYPPLSPRIEQYYPIHPSRVWFHQKRCRCMRHHPCVPGTDAPIFGYVNPRLQYFHLNSMKNRCLHRGLWPEHNRRGQMRSILPLFWASQQPNPRYKWYWPLLPLLVFCHQAIVYMIGCNYPFAIFQERYIIDVRSVEKHMKSVKHTRQSN